MQRVSYRLVNEVRQPQTRVVVTFENGERIEETAQRSHGSPSDPLTDAEVLGKFHECAEGLVSQPQRERVIELCKRLETLDDVRELTDTIGAVTA
jgi:2-methylcitrate dehydratase PrpD